MPQVQPFIKKIKGTEQYIYTNFIVLLVSNRSNMSCALADPQNGGKIRKWTKNLQFVFNLRGLEFR